MADIARSASISPVPPMSPSSASSSETDLPPSPRLDQRIPIVRVATEPPHASTSRLIWGDEDHIIEPLRKLPRTAVGSIPGQQRRPNAPKRRGTVAAAENYVSRSTSMLLPSPEPHKTSPVKALQASALYGRRASTSLLPEERPRPVSHSSSSFAPIQIQRSEPDPETLNAKMCVIGDAGVGKTSRARDIRPRDGNKSHSRTVINRYINGSFSQHQPSTIGASLLVKKMVLPEGKINFQLWDTAGQERFRSLAPMYYRDCEAAAIVFDLTNRASFLAVKQWLIQIRKHAQNRDNLVLHFVGTKLDLAPQVSEDDKGASTSDANASHRQVSSTEARELIHQWLCEPERNESSSALPPSASPGSPTLSPTRRPLAYGRSSTESERPPLVQRASFFDFLAGRKALEEPAPPPKAWAVWDYSEVSAKTNKGVDEIFLHTSRRLLVRRNTIKHRQELRHRNSIYLNEAAAVQATSQSTLTGYSCC